MKNRQYGQNIQKGRGDLTNFSIVDWDINYGANVSLFSMRDKDILWKEYVFTFMSCIWRRSCRDRGCIFTRYPRICIRILVWQWCRACGEFMSIADEVLRKPSRGLQYNFSKVVRWASEIIRMFWFYMCILLWLSMIIL